LVLGFEYPMAECGTWAKPTTPASMRYSARNAIVGFTAAARLEGK